MASCVVDDSTEDKSGLPLDALPELFVGEGGDLLPGPFRDQADRLLRRKVRVSVEKLELIVLGPVIFERETVRAQIDPRVFNYIAMTRTNLVSHN